MKYLSLLAVLCLVTPALAGEKAEDEAGFIPLQGEKNAPVEGWEKTVTIEDNGYMGGGGRYLKQQFGDFVLRFDFKVTAAANSGIGIRTDKEGNPAYQGIESQILEDSDKQYAGLQPYQFHGSLYGVVPAKRGALKPIGEWNTEEIYVKGDHIKVTLNGTVIVDAKLSEAAPEGKTIDKQNHPGLFNKTGYIAICGHGGGVAFRNMRIKPLEENARSGAGAEKTN